jgi:hypothetical protein
MIDFILGLIEPQWKDGWRHSSLEEVLNLIRGVEENPKKTYVTFKKSVPRRNDFPASIYSVNYPVIDFCYKHAGIQRLKIKNASPEEVIRIISENFLEENCFVIEKRQGSHSSRKPLIFHYDIIESIPTEEYYALGGRIHEQTGKTMRVTKRVKELETLDGLEASNYRSLPYF